MHVSRDLNSVLNIFIKLEKVRDVFLVFLIKYYKDFIFKFY